MPTLVSIVTPSFQQGEFIEDTLKSVLEQDYPHLEQWVVDAGSTDRTLDVVRTHATRHPARLKWTSEPDRGQSDAINKGFRRAAGEILAWLNADDMYYPGVIRRVASIFDADPSLDAVYGQGTFLTRQGTFLTAFPHNQAFDARKLLAGYAFLLQPTVFWRRRVFERVGYLAEDLHFGMDYDLWCRMARAGMKFHYDAGHHYAAARFYRETKTASGQWRRSREMRRIAARHSSRTVPAITFFAWLEALMATSWANGIYRPVKKWLSGLEKDYWEIPAPEVSGSFSLHFPWYRPLSFLEVDVLARGRYVEAELAASSEGRELGRFPMRAGTTTLRLPWRQTDAHIALDLSVRPAIQRFRVIHVRVPPAP